MCTYIALLDMKQVHSGICELGVLNWWWMFNCVFLVFRVIFPHCCIWNIYMYMSWLDNNISIWTEIELDWIYIATKNPEQVLLPRFQNNTVSQWLGANLESALISQIMAKIFDAKPQPDRMLTVTFHQMNTVELHSRQTQFCFTFHVRACHVHNNQFLYRLFPGDDYDPHM